MGRLDGVDRLFTSGLRQYFIPTKGGKKTVAGGETAGPYLSLLSTMQAMGLPDTVLLTSISVCTSALSLASLSLPFFELHLPFFDFSLTFSDFPLWCCHRLSSGDARRRWKFTATGARAGATLLRGEICAQRYSA